MSDMASAPTIRFRPQSLLSQPRKEGQPFTNVSYSSIPYLISPVNHLREMPMYNSSNTQNFDFEFYPLDMSNNPSTADLVYGIDNDNVFQPANTYPSNYPITSGTGYTQPLQQMPSFSQRFPYPEADLARLRFIPDSAASFAGDYRQQNLSSFPGMQGGAAHSQNPSPQPTTASLSPPHTPASISRSTGNSPHPQPSTAPSPSPQIYSRRDLLTYREQYQKFCEALELPVISALGPFVPQPMYKPHTNSDRKRYVEEIKLDEPILFWMNDPEECGISLADALQSRVKRLRNRDEPVFEGRGPSVSIRLEWPGYRRWSRQIPTKDFKTPPRPITLAKLAKGIAKCVRRFIEERQHLPLDDDVDPQWRVGTHGNVIKLEDIILVGIYHVSLGSWQPQLKLKRPLNEISQSLGQVQTFHLHQHQQHQQHSVPCDLPIVNLTSSHTRSVGVNNNFM